MKGKGYLENKVQGKNFSGSGFLFESSSPFKIGAQVEMQISAPNISPPITVMAQVARVEKFDSYFDIGVSFVEINDTSRNEIAKTLAQNLGIPISQVQKEIKA